MIYNDIKFGLQNLGCSTAPAQLHGSVSGFSCVRRSPADSTFMAHLMQTELAAQPSLDPVFYELADVTFEQLLAGQFEFELLLPDDDEPLDERISALKSWVIGFLSGLGSAGFQATQQLPDDVQEVLVDLANLAQAEFESAQGSESDESDFFELSEFVKVAVLLLFESLHISAEEPPAPESLH